MAYKLLSLFDGSGGFPLAGSLCGVEPVAASEVEPYPIAVTRSRFPGMKHLGDISKINGAEIEPVHIITFGSPCQDLSAAGKRAGIKHEANGDEETTRSGLFMDAIRIIKEMWEATNGVYPNVVLWENVPGAFSSNGGEDFRIVLDELIKIVEPDAVMPPVPKAGWAYADSYTGDGWSLAYRVFDAQYWGVPRRRRRIHLVLDLRGQRARKILFERDGLRGYYEAGANLWKGTETDFKNGVGAANREGEDCCVTFGFPLGFRPENVNLYKETATTIVNGTRPGFCNGIVIGLDCYNQALTGEKAKSLTGAATDSDHVPCIIYSAGFMGNQGANAAGVGMKDEKSTCITGAHKGLEPTVCIAMATGINGDIAGTLDASYYKGCGMRQGVEREVIVQTVVPIHDQATRFSGKRGDKYDGKGNGIGIGHPGDPMNTLTSGDRHAVCYAYTYQKCTGPLMANSHPGSYSGQDAYQDMLVVGQECAGIDCRNMNEYVELYPTLQAKPNGGQSLNFSGAVRVCYIVRRLTPLECNRLQGFADAWGVPDQKDDFTDEDYRFWLEVRNTHAEINGKVVKDYTKDQMLKWYNKLHTDSAEYKMWGNGIALPPALYCMQGIVDALNEEAVK